MHTTCLQIELIDISVTNEFVLGDKMCGNVGWVWPYPYVGYVFRAKEIYTHTSSTGFSGAKICWGYGNDLDYVCRMHLQWCDKTVSVLNLRVYYWREGDAAGEAQGILDMSKNTSSHQNYNHEDAEVAK